MPYAPSGGDPRGRQQNQGDYQQGRMESQYGPYMQWVMEQMGRAGEQGWQDYGDIQGGYDTIMGLPQGRPPYPPMPQQTPPQGGPPQQGPTQAPSQEAIMSLFPNGMTPEALKAAQPKLLEMGIHLQNEVRGDLRPRMLMPDGRTVDLGDWGGPAQWQDRGDIGNWHAAYERGERGSGDSSGGMQQGGRQQGGMSTFADFATTGGYSKEDIANMRARGVSPIRAAYANAEREIQRNRSLQGGYSPNMAAARVKMARERGQAGADAAQNVEASLAEMKNQGKRFGLTGMASALQGKAGMYGATPGMANMFGNNALNAMNQSASHGTANMNAGTAAQNLPGQWDTTTGRVNDIMDWVNAGTNVAAMIKNRKQKPTVPYQGQGTV
jgi:hypothetical protein